MMTQFADCNTKFSDHSKYASLALKQLMGAQAFAQLESLERERLEKARWLVRTVDKGCALIDEGEEREMIDVLLSGWAFRYQTLADGKRQILDFIFAGALVGFGSGNTYSYGVETVTTCTVATLPHGQFRQLLTACPTLAMQVVERVSDSEMRAHEHVTSLGRRGARERIAALIMELISRAGCTDLDKHKISIDLPVTQTMIGDALGLSNEHVCRLLGKFAGDGVVEIKNHTWKVLDQTALTREAGIESIGFAFHKRTLPAAA
jgi:CRP/FNR family transcriptional regulator